MPEPVTQHLNQQELSDRWRLSARTLERWRHVGTGPGYIRIGGRVAYPLADITAFEAAHHVVPTVDDALVQEQV